MKKLLMAALISAATVFAAPSYASAEERIVHDNNGCGCVITPECKFETRY